MGKSIRISNGKETFDVDSADVQSASKDGFYPVQRFIVANPKTKESYEIDPKDAQAAFGDGFVFSDLAKKKDGPVSAKPVQDAGNGVSPTKSQSVAGDSFYDSVGGNKFPKLRAKTLEEAHAQDKNWGGNLWNKFLEGTSGMISGATDKAMSFTFGLLPESVLGTTSDNAVKQFRESVTPTVKETFTNKLGANVTPQEKANFDGGTVSGAIGALVQSIPAMAAPKGTKMAALFFQAYDGALSNINSTEEGAKLPESTKTNFAMITGGAQAALEKLGLDKIFGKQSTKVAFKLAAKTLADLAKKSTVPITAKMVDQAIMAAAKTLKEKVVKAGGKITGGALVEFGTGSAQEISNILGEIVTNKATGKQVFDDASFAENAKRVAKSGTAEAIGGTLMGGFAIPFSKTRNYIAEKVSEAKSPEDIEMLKSELVAQVPNLSEAQVEAMGKTIDNYVRVNSKIPESVSNRKEVVEKVMEREDIETEVSKKEAELENTDEAFQGELKEDIEVLKNRAKEINGEVAEISKAETVGAPEKNNIPEPYNAVFEPETPTTEAVDNTVDPNSPYRDVQSTADALKNKMDRDDKMELSLITPERFAAKHDGKYIAETFADAYHDAVKNGDNPKLVKYVETTIGYKKPEVSAESTKTPSKTDNTLVGESKDKTDAGIEKRMADIEEKHGGIPSRSKNEADAKEYNLLEKEMEKRERASVFDVPLNEVPKAVDALAVKEKDKPNGFGAFIDKQDARETKAIAEKYLDAKNLHDNEVIKDFKSALRGNPDTWYADGLKLRESMKEAADRGIDINTLLEAVEKDYTKDGIDKGTAKGVILDMVKKVFKDAQKVETSESKLIENEKENTTTTDISKPSKEKGVADKEADSDSGNSGKEPPKAKTETVGEPEGVISFKKAEFQSARDRLGINEFVDEGKTTHIEESAKALKVIEGWIKDGTYAENIGDIQKRAALGKISTQEQFIFAKHLADLDATVNSIKDVNSKEYDSALKEYRNAVDAADKARSEFGRQLGMVAKNHGEVRTVADVMVRMMDDNLVDVLTPEQKAEAQKRFDELNEPVKMDEKAKEEYEKTIDELRAELEFERAKKEVQREKAGRKAPVTQEQRDARRADIKSRIKEKWANAGNDNTLSVSVPYAKQLMAIAPEVGELIKTYIDGAKDASIETVRRLLKKDLEEANIPVTDEEVRALIAGRYAEKKQTRSELAKQVSEIKQEEKLLLAIEDIENGKEPEKPRARELRNQKLKELKGKLEDLRKQAGVGRYSDDARFESSAKARITANNKLKEKYEEKLRKGDFAPDPQKQRIIENNELQKRHPELFKKVIKAQNERYEAELNFEKKSIEDKMKNWSVGRKALHGLDIAITTAKGSVAMVDQSAVFVQALLYTGGHPLKSAGFAGKAFRDLFNADRFDAAMFKLHNSPEWALVEKSGLAMFEPHTPKAELRNELHGGDKNFFNKNIGIPKIEALGIKGWDATIGGRKLSPGKAFERSVSTFLNNARLDLFHKQIKSGIEAGKTFESDPDFFKGAARIANELTGHGKVHSMIDQATGEGLNKIIWSPKMFASSMNMLGIGDAVNALQGKKGFYASLSGEQRRFVAGQLGRFIGMGVVAYAVTKAMGGEADLDPRSSKFGTISIGDYDIPLFGRYGSAVRTIIQVAMAEKISKDGSVNKIGDKYGEDKPMEVLAKSFVRGKMTPLAGLGYDAINGMENAYTHEKITLKKAILSQVIPMAANDILDFIKNDPNIKGIVASLALIYGLNVRNEKISDAKFEAIKAATERAKRTERTERKVRQ